jgi:precorrin-6B methylase 2
MHAKISKKHKDEHFAAHIPGVLQFHAKMLADELRNRLLCKAIKDNLKPGMSFLDIGAGCGIWAILAARLGAKRVVAVEIEECLIPVIYKHAVENGVADRIEIIHADVNHVKLRGKFDVIVSELFGNDAFGETTIRSMIDVRERFLAKGGKLIPQKLALMAAPARLEKPLEKLPAGLVLKTDFLKTLRFNYGQTLSLAERDTMRLLAQPKTLAEVDFTTVAEPPPLENLYLSWKLRSVRQANAIATFNHSTFTDAIEMDAFGSQSWGASVVEFRPFDVGRGELDYRSTFCTGPANWSISVPSDPNQRPQSFGPLFAIGRLRLAQQVTPHRRCKARKAVTPHISTGR